MSETTQAKLNAESDRAIAEFLAKGGKIEHAPIGKSGQLPGEETNVWGRRVKKKVEVPTVDPEDTED